MAKCDIRSAFRLLPVLPEQYHLLGMKWNDNYYFDKCMPMGARSSCNLFELFSTGLEFISKKANINYIIHYLDDFMIVGRSHKYCMDDLNKFLNICIELNVPIAPEKTVLPSQVIQFLGIEIDSIKQEVRLPMDKIVKCRNEIKFIIGKDKCSLKELQSIMGLLNFACSVIMPGRAFIESIRILTKGLKKQHHKRRLTKQAKLDLRVWLEFLEKCNGVTLYKEEMFFSPGVVHIWTDASQLVGLGAVLGCQWFALEWPTDWWRNQNITLLEFIPILLALETWKNIIKNKVVKIHTDNQSLVSIINKQHSDEHLVRVVLRGFVLTLLNYNILVRAEHVPGHKNLQADALSRNLLLQFRVLHPLACPEQSQTPPLPPSLESTTTWTLC